MKKKIAAIPFALVCTALQNSDAKTATLFLDEKTIVRATWRQKPRARNTREEMVVTFGVPNYLEQRLVDKCKRLREKLPTTVQFRAYPVKKKKA